MRGSKTLEEQRKLEANTHLHLRKDSNSTRSHITKTIVVTGQPQKILTLRT